MVLILLQFTLSNDFFEKVLMIVIPSVLAALLTWLATRRKNSADMAGVWQKMYLEVVTKLEEFRDKAEEVESEFDRARKELNKCRDGEEDCQEFRKKVNIVFAKTELALKDLTEHGEILEEIRNVRRRHKFDPVSFKEEK